MQQLDRCRVRPSCDAEGRTSDQPHCASIEFDVRGGPLIPGSDEMSRIIPFEGRALDADGIPMELLLFHRNGSLRELEFVIYSDRQKRMPRGNEIELIPRQQISADRSGAGGGGRTHTPLRAADFKSAASADFATPACCDGSYLPRAPAANSARVVYARWATRATG